MIIGGAYQGKLQFAVKKYGIYESEIADGRNFDISKISEIKCIYNYHLTVKKIIESGENPLDFTLKLLVRNPEIIIIMDEIGGGIIPLDKNERIWREQVGKVGCFLSERAETVERIVCGLSVKIKG